MERSNIAKIFFTIKAKVKLFTKPLFKQGFYWRIYSLFFTKNRKDATFKIMILIIQLDDKILLVKREKNLLKETTLISSFTLVKLVVGTIQSSFFISLTTCHFL